MRPSRPSVIAALGGHLAFGAMAAIWLTGPGGDLSPIRFAVGAAVAFGVEFAAIRIGLRLFKESSS